MIKKFNDFKINEGFFDFFKDTDDDIIVKRMIDNISDISTNKILSRIYDWGIIDFEYKGRSFVITKNALKHRDVEIKSKYVSKLHRLIMRKFKAQQIEEEKNAITRSKAEDIERFEEIRSKYNGNLANMAIEFIRSNRYRIEYRKEGHANGLVFIQKEYHFGSPGFSSMIYQDKTGELSMNFNYKNLKGYQEYNGRLTKEEIDEFEKIKAEVIVEQNKKEKEAAERRSQLKNSLKTL